MLNYCFTKLLIEYAMEYSLLNQKQKQKPAKMVSSDCLNTLMGGFSFEIFILGSDNY